MSDIKIIGSGLAVFPRKKRHKRHKHHKHHEHNAGCKAVKSPYFINVCKDKDACKSCQPTTEKDGISLSIQDVGKDINGTIVMVGPILADAEIFLYQVQNLSSLGYRVITVTQRGVGNSDQPNDTYTYNTWADDLKQVLDCLDVHHITLVGHSGGSGTALHYTARHKAHRVAKLVLSATLPLDPTFELPPAVIDGLVAGALADYPANTAVIETLLFDPFVPSTETFDYIFGLLLQTTLYAAIQQGVYVLQTAANESVLIRDLPHIHVPTLILHGVDDVIAPFGIALQLQAGIAGSTLVPFTTSGHLLLLTQIGLYNSEIAAFAADPAPHRRECALPDPKRKHKKLVAWHSDGPKLEDA